MNFLHILVFSLSIIALPNNKEKLSPIQLAQAQLDAYNIQDMEAFLNCYSDDVEIYNFPNELVYKGKDKMRERYQKSWAKNPNQIARVSKRIVNKRTVVDREHVTGRVKQEEVNIIVIYKIKDFKIKQVYFIRE